MRGVGLEAVERWVGWAGGVAFAVFLGVALVGIARARRRPPGRSTGLARWTLRPLGYVVVGAGFFGACLFLWRPLPLAWPAAARAVALCVGALLYFSGLALYVWARLTLGEMYNVSSSVGAQLFADHRLVTHGPYRVVRHPMYLGVLAASLGGLLLYRTWTAVFAAIAFAGLLVRARREEEALAAEFGDAWQAYCRRVPGWIPRIRKPN